MYHLSMGWGALGISSVAFSPALSLRRFVGARTHSRGPKSTKVEQSFNRDSPRAQITPIPSLHSFKATVHTRRFLGVLYSSTTKTRRPMCSRYVRPTKDRSDRCFTRRADSNRGVFELQRIPLASPGFRQCCIAFSPKRHELDDRAA